MGRRLAALVLAVLIGCTEGGQSAPAGGASTLASVIRLGEHLATAEIQSPMLEVEAVDVETLAGARAERILAEGFEQFSPAAAHWSKLAGCKPDSKPDGQGKALVYDGRNAHRCVWVIPAQPSTHYRFSRAIFTDDSGVDLRVMESRLALQRPSELNHPIDLKRVAGGKFPAMKDLLYVHRFAPPEPNETWQLHAMHVATTPFARSFVLAINDAQGVVSAGQRRVWLDDVVVERLEPTRDQELALLKLQMTAGSDAGRGIYKHAQFLPIGNVSTAEPPYDANYDHRYGLFAPAPTTIRFDLDLPDKARLAVSMGMFKMSRPQDEATFRVRIRAGSKQETLLEKTLRVLPRGEGWHWHEATVPLAAYASQRVRLTLETTAPAKSRGLAVWGNPTVTMPRKSSDPPSVVLIAVDTLRAGRLRAYGYRRKTSPAIDQLAADGVLFASAISPSNWTSPAFASIFTGVLPSRHQVVHRARSISSDLKTITEHFREAGWSTYGVAFKAYLYNMGFERGFDTYFNIPRPEVTADANLSQALAWLERHQSERFFFFIHFNDPHQPFNQPPPYERRFNRLSALKRLGAELPLVIEPTGGVRGCRWCRRGGKVVGSFKRLASDLYDGEVAFVDNRIGVFLQALRERGLYENTVIAFVSDHGEMMWEQDEFYGHGGPYLREELIHVPMIVKPAKGSLAKTGTTVDTLVRAHDLMPTLLELAGLPAELEVDAKSVVPLMRGEAEQSRRIILSENIKHGMLSIRDGRYKYVIHHPLGGRTSERLFDLQADPTEKRSFAKANPTIHDRLRSLAMLHFLSHRHGHYLLVTGDGRQRYYEVALRADRALRSAQTIIGLGRWGSGASRVVRFGGDSKHPIVLLARFDGVGARGVTVTVRGEPGTHFEETIGPAGFLPFSEDALEPPSDERPVRIAAFHVSERAGGEPEAQAASAEQLEALRALGYVQ